MDEKFFDRVEFIRPWQRISAHAREAYELELRTEMRPDHGLYSLGPTAKAVARMCTCDDILFWFPGHTPPLAVVHLTFIGKQEHGPQWPSFKLLQNFEEWIEKYQKPDIEQFQKVLRERFKA